MRQQSNCAPTPKRPEMGSLSFNDGKEFAENQDIGAVLGAGIFFVHSCQTEQLYDNPHDVLEKFPPRHVT